MKRYHYILLSIPVVCTILAVTGHGFFFRAAVSASCAALLLLFPDRLAGNSIWWVIAGLTVSIVGDRFMVQSGKNPAMFLCGVCFFFFAHVGFLIFCLKNGRINFRVLVIILTGYLIFFFTMLSPALNQALLFIAVLMYLFVSCTSLAAAVGLQLPAFTKWCYVTGIILFVFSDTLIGLRSFSGYENAGFLVLPTYFASHIFICLALMQKKSKS